MTIRDVIEKHGHFAHGGNPDDTAETWAESGFEASTEQAGSCWRNFAMTTL
jgi:hypothetical protein